MMKETFVAFCELQRSANSDKQIYGEDDERTLIAYEKANREKRKFIDMLDIVDNMLKEIDKI